MTIAEDKLSQLKSRRQVVRFAGDSGDGIQLVGLEFAKSAARDGTDFMTLPEFPAEIRAPVGTTFGVSAYQIQFGPPDVLTPGDEADVLVAFNPAALKTNLDNVRKGSTIIVDQGSFDKRGLTKAGFEENPLETDYLADYQVIVIDISQRTLETLAELELGRKNALRAKNFWALGLILWMAEMELDKTEAWIREKFGPDSELATANIKALKAGHAYGETLEISPLQSRVGTAREPDMARHRMISGTQAMAEGIAQISSLSERQVMYCSYPITPASNLLHELARKPEAVRTVQSEDEIAAVCMAIGASYAGALGITTSSGPGLSLKTEGMGLAVTAEIPLIVIDVQRAGPSTGMPTKPEQSDLLMAIFGRHGESPLPVLAPKTPADCYWIMLEAAEIAVQSMCPVIVLSDAFLANAASDWTPPDEHRLNSFKIRNSVNGPADPFERNSETLARPWVTPGLPGLEHRVGGLEKDLNTGNISYDPVNHQQMTDLRAEKVQAILKRQEPIEIETGAEDGDLLIVGWGSTYGPIRQTVLDLMDENDRIGHVHLRQLWPLPRGLQDIMNRYKKVVCVEMNSGQLSVILRSTYLMPVQSITQVTGQPFRVETLKAKIQAILES